MTRPSAVRGIAFVAAAAPAVAGVVIALVLVAVGDRHELVLTASVAAVWALAGILLTAAAALSLVIGAGRRAARERVAAARAAGLAEGREQERAAHNRFLARLDHELKNPVTAIMAMIAADRVQGASGSLTAVDAQAARLARLVGDLRKLADLDTRELEFEQVDLEGLVRESVAAVTQQHPGAADRVQLAVTRVPWPVPALRADPDLLGLAVDNVIGNAVKFGDGAPIEVRVRETDGWAVVEVADGGRGVPEEAAGQVFDELARADNARDVAGSGIGLAMVRTVLRRHGGEASLRSREGEGTVVTLRLPIGGGGDA